MKFVVTVEIASAYDALQHDIQHGASKQSVYAGELGIDQSVFSRLFNDPTSKVYEILARIEAVEVISTHKTYLHYLADKCGMAVVRKEGIDPDEKGQYDRKKKNGELPKP